MTEARIQFGNLKGFPAGDHDKIETEQFLAASNEIVDVIRKFCFIIFANASYTYLYNKYLQFLFILVLKKYKKLFK